MYIQGRPPVTNLYSAAVFIGWGTLVVALILEVIYHNGIGNGVAALTGLITMSLAQFLGGSGDTMEMMQAVLDTNFWLATHVTVVTTGYAATLVAGFLGIVFVARLFCRHCLNVLQAPHTTRDLVCLVIGGILGGFLVFGLLALLSLLYTAVRSILGMPRRPILSPVWGFLERSALDQGAVKTLGQMIYGIICFATLMSFTGTVLGGIWADQSWGRFWGWDPKENGALIIVIWNAMILHARWAGMIKQRGMAVLAIIGNIVVGWSGIGTNQLGVGLHAYGFSNKLAAMLFWFWASQVVFILLGLLPTHLWRSFGGTIVAPRTARA
jgi:ABC-type transport system involved in cytochrome c biogenesis permease subunit